MFVFIVFYNVRCFIMFVTAVCVLFLLKLKWPKNKSFYDVMFIYIICFMACFHEARVRENKE